MSTRPPPSGRLAGKELTRQALVSAALTLLAQSSFDHLSLREVTRAAGISPTAFYRHFDDMEELGLVLVTESLAALGEMLAAAQVHAVIHQDAIDGALAVVVQHVCERTAEFRFIARERDGGVRRLRLAINGQLAALADGLAGDLVGVPGVDRWTATDRRMLAGSLIETIIRMVAELLEAEPIDQHTIVERAGSQLRLISVAVPAWDGARTPGAALLGEPGGHP